MEKTGFLLFRKRDTVSDIINQAKENKTEISVQPYNNQENYVIKKQKHRTPISFYTLGKEFLLAGLLLVAFYFLEDDD